MSCGDFRLLPPRFLTPVLFYDVGEIFAPGAGRDFARVSGCGGRGGGTKGTTGWDWGGGRQGEWLRERKDPLGWD